MSCLGPNYNPVPTKEWYRFQNRCPSVLFNSSQNIINIANALPQSYEYNVAVYKKGNVLQYKKNSANLTKNQRYSQIAKGMWTNRTKTWASQSESVTNANSDLLKQVNYDTVIVPNYSVDGTEIIAPVLSTSVITSCLPIVPKSYPALPITTNRNANNFVLPPPPTSPPANSIIMPPYVYRPKIITPAAIQTGGSLIGTITSNPCTGKILQQTYIQECYSTSESDVPGPETILCWNDGLQTYYPKTKLTYGTSGNKWPTNAKLIFSANSIKPVNKPVISLLPTSYY
uniref:Uncharacterized protein n=1 Tax=viral metagenome TaxID=1070528 RepID=A0A6C0HBT2_9ZZZZ